MKDVKDVKDQLAGWPASADGTAYNTFEAVGWDSDPLACRSIPDTGAGNVDLATARSNDKFCVRTHEGRWALVTITQLSRRPRLP